MDAGMLLQGLGLVGVVLVGVWEVVGQERAAGVRRARAVPSGEARRCPFCHREFELDEEQVRCAGCGARHHAECWAEHRSCSIYGCGCRVLQGAQAEGQVPTASPAEQPAGEDAVTSGSPRG